jgi:hypothetical protein
MDKNILDALIKYGFVTNINVNPDKYVDIDDLINKGVVTIPGAKSRIMELLNEYNIEAIDVNPTTKTETDVEVLLDGAAINDNPVTELNVIEEKLIEEDNVIEEAPVEEPTVVEEVVETPVEAVVEEVAETVEETPVEEAPKKKKSKKAEQAE